MTLETKQYVSRPCKTLDSPALWDWLESERPEIMVQFTKTFIREVRRYYWKASPQYPKLREHIEKFIRLR